MNLIVIFVKVYWLKYIENVESIVNDYVLKYSLISFRGKNSLRNDCVIKMLFVDFYYFDVYN